MELTYLIAFFVVFVLQVDSFHSDPAFVTWQVKRHAKVLKLVKTVDLNNDGIFSREELIQLKQLSDLNKDGIVQRCEYVAASSSVMDREFAEFMFDTQDHDLNGVLFTNGSEVDLNQVLDRNKDGVITIEEGIQETKEAMRNASINQYMAINGPVTTKNDEYEIPRSVVIDVYRQFVDTNKDGYVTQREFIDGLLRHKSLTRCEFQTRFAPDLPQNTESFISKAFSLYDINNDETLDATDVLNILHNADENGDGRTSFDEIIQWDDAQNTIARWKMGLPYHYYRGNCKTKLPFRGMNVTIFAGDIDYNRNGLVTPAELTRHFHEQWDRNWDGVLDYEEYEYKNVHRFGSTPEQSKIQFDFDDYNKDGVIDLDIDFPFLQWDKNQDGVLQLCTEVVTDMYRVSELAWAELHGKDATK